MIVPLPSPGLTTICPTIPGSRFLLSAEELPVPVALVTCWAQSSNTNFFTISSPISTFAPCILSVSVYTLIPFHPFFSLSCPATRPAIAIVASRIRSELKPGGISH